MKVIKFFIKYFLFIILMVVGTNPTCNIGRVSYVQKVQYDFF
ncbi:hypothetical protein CSCA_4837 [Clostridium scatologenes]|uniref:Uncharacterized protein n=1 Tax=Clostridium scatologenes TaxID=1548 RepID=A0A0E3K4G2_CLOSL|nr:hypothetical protein CSCA_4837 [Clostridium scatologenes]